MITAKIDNLAVTTGKIADLAVTTAKIDNLAVTTAQIADASITSAKIANLAVGTAQIDNASITSAKIGALAVDTLNIADNAVTLPASAYTSGAISCPASTWTTIQSVSFTAVGQPVFINFGFLFEIDSSGGATNIAFRVQRNGTTIWDVSGVRNFDSAGGNRVHSSAIADAPGAGAVTYTLDVNSLATHDASARTLLCLECRK